MKRCQYDLYDNKKPCHLKGEKYGPPLFSYVLCKKHYEELKKKGVVK